MSEKLNILCKKCDFSWDEFEIKKCNNCGSDDLTIVHSIDTKSYSTYIYLIVLLFVITTIYISKNYFDLDMPSQINHVLQKDEQKDGLLIKYYQNGQTEARGDWKDGKRNGLWKYYYENGQTEMTGNWKDGKRTAVWNYYDKNGLPDFQERWEDGDIIEFYNSSGQSITAIENKDSDEINISQRNNWSDKEETHISEKPSTKTTTSKVTIRYKSFGYLPTNALVSPDGKYLYFDVGINPFKGFVFDLRKGKGKFVGSFSDKGYGIVTSHNAFYDKEDNKLYFECQRNVGSVSYTVSLDGAYGWKISRFNKSGWAEYCANQGYQKVFLQELGEWTLNGSTFQNTIKLDDYSLIQILLDRVVIIR